MATGGKCGEGAPHGARYTAGMSPRPLAVIGFGNMGGAILAGAVRAGVINASDLFAADREPAARANAARLGATVYEQAADALDAMIAAELEPGSAVLLLAVKPQMLADVGAALRPRIGQRLVISILAGTPTQRVRDLLGGDVRVVRAMPNLPAAVGLGVTALCVGEGATAEDAAFAQQIFAGVGPDVIPLPESLFDAFTAVAGSGPAYLFYLAESMMQGAVAQGMSQATARQAVVQTLIGAAAMLRTDGREADALRRAVTSPGGTTQAAISVLEAAGVGEALVRAIGAATNRGRELGAAS
jgi:pyrroline-5-carboxylate reductase